MPRGDMLLKPIRARPEWFGLAFAHSNHEPTGTWPYNMALAGVGKETRTKSGFHTARYLTSSRETPMTQQTFKSAKRRYHRVFWPLMVAYTIIILAGSYGINQLDPEPKWMQVSLAIASALPVIATLFVMLRYINETDEYTRLVQLKSFAWGAAITVSAIFLIGFLQLFDAIGAVEVFWFGPMFFLAYGFAKLAHGGRDCA